jgi:hypothetical protein
MNRFLSSTFLISMTSIQLIFSLIFIIFTICMLKDQWDIIQNETTLIDLKQKRFLEKVNSFIKIYLERF